MRREIAGWHQEGLIDGGTADALASRYAWRHVVLAEVARWEQEGAIPADVARRIEARYAPVVPAPQPIPPTPPPPELMVVDITPAGDDIDLLLDAAVLLGAPADEGPPPPEAPARAAAPPSLANRLLQSFVEEANLHWLLYAGIFLIVASSVFLVASQWSAIPYSLQYLILLVYTSGFYVGAWQMLSRFELRRTGGALVVVTTLLIPLNFWGMQALGLFRDPAGWFLALPAAAWLAAMTYLCAAHIHRDIAWRFTLGFIPLALAQAAIGLWAPAWGTMAVALLVLGTVWRWTRLPEPAFADEQDRRATWAFLLGGLAYGGLLTTGRLFAHTGLTPFAPLSGPLLAIWAGAVLLAARRFPDREQPERATALHGAAYVMALVGMLVARPEPAWLWLAAATAAPLYVAAVRWHRRPFYLYLAALAIGVAYFFTPALFPVIAAAFRDQLAASMGYARMPWPFYGVTLFPLALAALGASRLFRAGFGLAPGPAPAEEQHRRQQLAAHATGLSFLLAAACLAIAWNAPGSLAVSLALTTAYGILLHRAHPDQPLLAWLPAGTGLLALLAAGNLLAPLPWYEGDDPVGAAATMDWTPAGSLALALLGGLWVAAAYRLWWARRAPLDPAAEAPPPSPWEAPLLYVGGVAAAAALFAAGEPRTAVLAIGALVALAAGHVQPGRGFSVAFLILTQLALWALVLRHAPDEAWLACLVAAAGFFITGLVGLAGITGHIWPPPRPFLRLGRLLYLGVESRAWGTGELPATRGHWQASDWAVVAAVNAGALALVQAGLLAVGLFWVAMGLQPDLVGAPNGREFWLLAPLLAAVAVGVLVFYLLPAAALPWLALGVLVAAYTGAWELAVPHATAPFIALALGGLTLWAIYAWERAETPFFSRLGLPEDVDERRRPVRAWVHAVPALVVVALVATGARLDGLTALALGLAAACWLGLAALRHPAAALAAGARGASDFAAWVALALPAVACWWWLVAYAYQHPSGGHFLDLGAPLAAIALVFALLWQGLAWGHREDPAEGAGLHGQVLADWSGRGLLARLAAAHAVAAFLLVGASMARGDDLRVGLVLLGLGVYAGLALLAAWLAAGADRRDQAWQAEAWVYVAHLNVGFIYAYLRLTTAFLDGLDEYAPVVLALGAYVLIGVRQLVERGQVRYALQPTYVAALIVAVATLLAVGWQALWVGPLPIQPLAIWLAAGFFAHLAARTGQRRYAYLAALLVNAGLYLTWWNLGVTDQQAFLIPAGVLLLWYAQINRPDLAPAAVNQLRLAGLLILYGSSAFALLRVGSGLPALLLALTSIFGILAGIALRVRAYLYLGALFLLLDVANQLFFFSTQYAPAKWIVGFSLGLMLVGLAVLFESRREAVLARIKAVTDELADWD